MINYPTNFNKILLPILEKYQKEKAGKNIHYYFFEILDKTKKTFQKKYNDQNGQKWRNESGKMLEYLVLYFIADEIESMGYAITSDEELKSAKDGVLEKVAHNITLKYGQYFVLPDGDIVIYNPKTAEVKSIISCKASTRERYTQTLYWKLKLSLYERTKNIKVYFVTLDKEWNKDKTGFKKPSLDIKEGKEPTKARILLEHEMDGVYVGRDLQGESETVKEFDKFIGDLRKLLK